MLFRVVLAAVVSMALAVAGAGHAAPVAAAEASATVHSAVAEHDHGAHDGAHDAEAVSKQVKNDCSDPDRCIGCSAHCPAIALVESVTPAAGPRQSRLFTPRHERGAAGIVLTEERPPEAI